MSSKEVTQKRQKSIISFVSRNSGKIKIVTIVALLLVGGFLLVFGVQEHDKAIYESFPHPRGIVILGDNDTVIEDMRIILDKGYRVIDYEEGWTGVIIDFNSSCKKMDIGFALPYKVEFAHALNYTPTSFFYFNSTYNQTTDDSLLFIYYVSTEEENRVRVDFDWRVYEKVSLDLERISIGFLNPYYGKPLFQEVLSVYGLTWIPEIDKLTIEIKDNNLIDLSYTVPQPSYYYYTDREASVYWTFDSKREVSSIQAVFKNPVLSRTRLDVLFFSGLYISFGISTIISTATWAIKEVLKTAERLRTS